MIWSDDPESVGSVCAYLSKAVELASACYLSLPTDPRDLDGMLVIEQPRNGDWKVVIGNSDTASHMNAADEQAVDFLLTIIGKDTFSRPVGKLNPGESVELSSDISALHVD